MLSLAGSPSDEAEQMARWFHAGQKDKAGAPYVGHLARVAAAVASEDLKAVAWLHDILEDCPIIAADFLNRGVPLAVVEAVEAMTKRKGEPYLSYLARAKANPMARLVKLADLADNMTLDRIPNPGAEDHAQVEKYRAAMALLQEDTHIT